MNRLVILILVGVLVLLGAVVIVMALNQSDSDLIESDTSNEEPAGSQEDVTLAQRTNMHRILQEHAVTASLHLQALYDGQDTDETEKNLNENTIDFISLMQELSLNDSSEELETMWREHIRLYEQYTIGIRENNSQQAQQAQNNLEMHSREFGRIVNNLLPDVSEDRATQAMTEHVNLTLGIINAHSEEDDSEKATLSLRASTQAAEFAEILIPPTEGE